MNTDSRLVVTRSAPAHEAAGAQTLVDVLRYWAGARAQQPAYLYIADGKEQSITFAQLDERATAIAAVLRARCEPGATALLLHPLGLDFVQAFFGCLYAGVVAVPLHHGRGKSASARLRPVLNDCGARLVLTTSAVAAGLGDLLCGLDLELLETDRVSAPAGLLLDDQQASAPSPTALAFLQYTSGSTSQPKGTMVTHRNIMANQRMLQSVFGTNDSTVIASWLPIFHDMGLIGNVLHAAYLGVTAVLLSTLGFIKSPISWLRAIDRYRVTFSGGPNFAYDLCVAKTSPEQRAGLDLSSWRVAFNGAEPVRRGTLEEFSKAFAPYGFENSALVPTYGLAEATLVVSGSAGEGPRYLDAEAHLLESNIVAAPEGAARRQTLVSTGRYDHGDQDLVIVDTVSLRPCAPARVGEIWIAGSHVAAGYWRQSTATEQTFGAVLPGSDRRYLRTGDLGFVRDGAVFVTGRIKDLLIFRGQNLYPQDIELTVELACPLLRSGCTAAFTSGAGDSGGLVVVAELERRGEGQMGILLASVARQVQEQHELPLQRLVLVRRNSVPKTTSGKIQRQKCKAQYERGEYEVIAQWPDAPALSLVDTGPQMLAHAIAWIAKERRIPAQDIDPATSLGALGLDSILKVALIHSLEERFGIEVPEATFFALDTVGDLRQLAQRTDGAEQWPRALTAPVAKPRREAVLPTFSAMTWEQHHD